MKGESMETKTSAKVMLYKDGWDTVELIPKKLKWKKILKEEGVKFICAELLPPIGFINKIKFIFKKQGTWITKD